jgi:hypothetical protein
MVRHVFTLMMIALVCQLQWLRSQAQPQPPKAFIQTSANRSNILIGEHIRFTVKAYSENSLGFMRWFWFPDSTHHFEIIRREKIDTVRTGNKTTFEQTLVITSFDSGSWYIPSFPVDVVSGSLKRRLFSDSILVHVGYSPADSSGELRDIKPVVEVTIAESYLAYIIVAILILLLCILLYWYYRKRRSRPKPLLHSPVPAFDEAMKELNALKNSDQSGREKTREYYTKLAFIFKRYYSRSSQRMMMDKTTSDVLLGLKEDNIPESALISIAGVLRTADAVKFAKYIPNSETGIQHVQDITSAIQTMHSKTVK